MIIHHNDVVNDVVDINKDNPREGGTATATINRNRVIIIKLLRFYFFLVFFVLYFCFVLFGILNLNLNLVQKKN